MNELGWVSVPRSALSWEWYREPYTKDVFFHLYLIAQFKAISFKGIYLQRGQVITSIRQIAIETGISVRSVRTALNHLKTTQEVTQERHGKNTVFTVVNYDKYQQTDTNTDTEATQKRHRSDTHPDNKNVRTQELKNLKTLSSSKLAEEFEKIWADYPRKEGKKDAQRHYSAARKRGVEYDIIRAGVIAYRDHCVAEKTELRFIKQGSTYFSGEHWNDELSKAQVSSYRSMDDVPGY